MFFLLICCKNIVTLCEVLFALQYVRGVSISGMCLHPTQFSSLCTELSSLKQLTSLRLSNNVVDLTPSHRGALDALCTLLSATPTLKHLDLSDVCMTGCLHEILTSISSVRLARLEISADWLSQQDFIAVQQFRQRSSVTVIFN